MRRGGIFGGIGAATLLLGTALLLMLPALLSSKALTGDAPVHILWQSQFAPEVMRGNLYPRWLPGMNFGLGSPAFFFYPPLLQWFASLFAPFFPGVDHASLRIDLALWLLSAGGAIGIWAWLKEIGIRREAALFGALAYLLLPYRAYFDIYQRGALPELAGISVMPWLLFGAQRIKAQGPGGWSALALAFGIILYSHLPAAEMGILFAGAYTLALIERRDALPFLLRAGSAAAVGVLIGALCILPALTLLGHITNPSNMWGERQQPYHWLLFSHEVWPDPGLLKLVALLCLFTLAATALLGWLAWRTTLPLGRRIAGFCVASVIVVLLLHTEPARGFWMLQTPLSRIQFPFRLLAVTVPALAALAALALDASWTWRPAIARLLWLLLPGLLLIDVGLLALHARFARFVPMTNAQIVTNTLDTLEYVLDDFGATGALFGGRDAAVIAGHAEAQATQIAARLRRYDIVAQDPARIAIPQFAFTGWTCRIDASAPAPAATLPAPRRVPVCDVPPGRHQLELRQPAPLPERIGAWATFAGLMIALGVLAASLSRRRRL